MRTALFVILIYILAAGAACATGGIYIDDLQITNNGKVVFSDNFDRTSLTGWTDTTDASVVVDQSQKHQSALLLNSHISCPVAQATHSLLLKNAGLVEMSAAIYCTPADEQFQHHVKKIGCVTSFILGPTRSELDGIDAVIELNPNGSAYQLGVTSLRSGTITKSAVTTNPIMQPGKWALIKLRLDPKTATATVFLDGNAVASIGYNPEDYRKISEVNIVTPMGDGSKRTDTEPVTNGN